MIMRIQPLVEYLKNLIIVGPMLTISPFLLITVYLWCADHWFKWDGFTDIAALTIAMLIGVFGVLLLPISRIGRFIIAFPYTALTVWLIFLWAIVWRGGL
jgi:hypothetical protein